MLFFLTNLLPQVLATDCPAGLPVTKFHHPEVDGKGNSQAMSDFLSADSEERLIRRFEAEDISNYTALLLSQDGGTLYVGAQEALFALNSNLSFLPGGEYQKVRDLRG